MLSTLCQPWLFSLCHCLSLSYIQLIIIQVPMIVSSICMDSIVTGARWRFDHNTNTYLQLLDNLQLLELVVSLFYFQLSGTAISLHIFCTFLRQYWNERERQSSVRREDARVEPRSLEGESIMWLQPGALVNTGLYQPLAPTLMLCYLCRSGSIGEVHAICQKFHPGLSEDKW